MGTISLRVSRHTHNNAGSVTGKTGSPSDHLTNPSVLGSKIQNGLAQDLMEESGG